MIRLTKLFGEPEFCGWRVWRLSFICGCAVVWADDTGTITQARPCVLHVGQRRVNA